MSDTTEQLDPQVPDVLGMSEDELSRLDISQYLGDKGQVAPEDGNPVVETEGTPESQEPSDDPQPEPEAEQPEGEGEQGEPEAEEEGEDQAKPEAKGKPAKAETEKDSQGKDKSAPESQTVPDHKAFYESIIGKPFKANGRDIILQNPEDVIQLMQMGANYHEKMAALKPNRRILKMLENEKLLDEQTLGYLIDLHKKDPKAIAKLVQDSGIDLMEFDTEQGADYKSQHVAPPESQITLEDTVQELQSSPGFRDVLTNVTSTWDAESQNVIAEHPDLLRVLNAQKEAGHFDLIVNELAREKMLGRTAGMNSLQAYSAVEQRLKAEGKLGAPASKADPVIPETTPAKAPKKDNTAAKKAAAAPRQTVQNKKTLPEGENLFALSEEEFAKIDPSQFR